MASLSQGCPLLWRDRATWSTSACRGQFFRGNLRSATHIEVHLHRSILDDSLWCMLGLGSCNSQTKQMRQLWKPLCGADCGLTGEGSVSVYGYESGMNILQCSFAHGCRQPRSGTRIRCGAVKILAPQPVHLSHTASVDNDHVDKNPAPAANIKGTPRPMGIRAILTASA